jgi:hypothetical protein
MAKREPKGLAGHGGALGPGFDWFQLCFRTHIDEPRMSDQEMLLSSKAAEGDGRVASRPCVWI